MPSIRNQTLLGKAGFKSFDMVYDTMELIGSPPVSAIDYFLTINQIYLSIAVENPFFLSPFHPLPSPPSLNTISITLQNGRSTTHQHRLPRSPNRSRKRPRRPPEYPQTKRSSSKNHPRQPLRYRYSHARCRLRSRS